MATNALMVCISDLQLAGQAPCRGYWRHIATIGLPCCDEGHSRVPHSRMLLPAATGVATNKTRQAYRPYAVGIPDQCA